MKANYEKCLKVTLAFEGGYVNHPKDPGGATNFGVTQRVYDSYRKRIGKPAQEVRKIAQTEVRDIYKQQYWDAVHGDKLPVGIDLAVFDYAVNSGVSRAVRSVQKVLNNPDLIRLPEAVKEDGQLGMTTEAAIQRAYITDEEKFIILYCEDRWAFVNRLSTFTTFGKGWKKRIMGKKLGAQDTDTGVIDVALAMARGDKSIPIPKVAEVDEGGKADPIDTRITAEPEATAQGSTVLSAGGFFSGDWIISGLQSLGEVAGYTKDQLEPLADYSKYIKAAFVLCFVVSVAGSVGIMLKKRRQGASE